MKTVYTASTLRHGPMWKRLRDHWPEIKFTSSWLDAYMNWSGSEIPVICKDAWVQNELDVIRSTYVLVFADTQDSLRGGLVEAGMGIAFNKKLLIIGAHSSYGTWQYHPNVRRLVSLNAARNLINAEN